MCSYAAQISHQRFPAVPWVPRWLSPQRAQELSDAEQALSLPRKFLDLLQFFARHLGFVTCMADTSGTVGRMDRNELEQLLRIAWNKAHEGPARSIKLPGGWR